MDLQWLRFATLRTPRAVTALAVPAASCPRPAPPSGHHLTHPRRCVSETIRTPKSTFKDHFGPKADQPDADKVDKAYHYQKTDFSEYTEVKLKLMNHLK